MSKPLRSRPPADFDTSACVGGDKSKGYIGNNRELGYDMEATLFRQLCRE